MTDVPAHVLDYLSGHRTLSLATASRDGTPHASTMLYANDGPNLFIWTRPETTTARHLSDNPKVSFTIDDAGGGDWRKSSGVQGSGECTVVEQAGEIANLVGLFASKFEDEVAEESTAGIAFYRISPTDLRYIGGASPGAEGREDPVGTEFDSEQVS